MVCSSQNVPAARLLHYGEMTDGVSELVLRSADGMVTLGLLPETDREGHPYRATLASSTLRASALVQINRASLADYFETIADDWRRWKTDQTFTAHPAGTDYSPPALRITATA